MKNRNKGLRRAAAFILAAVLAGSSVEIPAAADGDTGTGNTGSGTVVVTVFSDLEEGIRTQTLDIGAEKTDITLPETLDVTLEIRSGESGVEAAAVVQEPETQTEPVTQEPVPDNMQTEENTGTQENPDGTQNQTDGPETDQGTENGTEPVTPPAAADTEQTETPGTEDPGTQQTEAPATEAPVQQQEEPAEPSGQEGQSAGADDNDDHTCRSDVLLDAAVDDAVLRDIHRLRQEAGGNVRYQRLTLGVRQLLEFCTVNGVVLADINIVRILADRKVRAVRNVGKGLILGGSDLIRFSVFLRLLVRLLRPLAGNDVIRHPVLHQVHRDHRKLLRSAVLQEQYLIVIRDVHQLAQILLRLPDDPVKNLSAVAHLHHRHSASSVIQHLICCFF